MIRNEPAGLVSDHVHVEYYNTLNKGNDLPACDRWKERRKQPARGSSCPRKTVASRTWRLAGAAGGEHGRQEVEQGHTRTAVHGVEDVRDGEDA
jgi:hypothetical protein